MNAKNMLPLMSATTVAFPDRVVVQWRRLSSGLWRVPEGDIQAAYCADTFPKIKVFMQEGRRFTNCGGHFAGPIRAAADCYPLIAPEEYCGSGPLRYTYEGCEAAFQGQVFKLGQKVVFSASEPTVEEWKRLLRVLYADGGMFAHGVTYLQFLEERISPHSENERVAHSAEIDQCGSDSMPRIQNEMRRLLNSHETNYTQSATLQMDFGL